MKKQPFHTYEKETKRKPFTGIMASDSSQRESTYLQTGCNSFSGKKSNPLGFWTEQDILLYISKYGIPYSKIYGDIVNVEGQLITTGETRTGCMFCMFGVHLEKGENRFQRMKRTHPKIYNYCMDNLGLDEVLNYIGVKH
jgi:3'-phosphoadenosine 5'-phosphosulfate sulfotransferase (PAPS reductase)/FAD synthetase